MESLIHFRVLTGFGGLVQLRTGQRDTHESEPRILDCLAARHIDNVMGVKQPQGPLEEEEAPRFGFNYNKSSKNSSNDSNNRNNVKQKTSTDDCWACFGEGRCRQRRLGALCN